MNGGTEPKEEPVTSFDEDEDEDEEEEAQQPVKSWDEGGPSDCGYSQSVHSTLMDVGGTVHSVFGPPSESVKNGIQHIGNWFQEASYAVRDIFRGENHKEMHEDANDALSTIMSGGAEKEEDNKQESKPAEP